jgi:branched-chain amino acid transport system substrate-binding protein
MKAVVQWINEYGGGIGADHRKLVFDDCPTNSDNAVAAACGSTIVDGGYPMVVLNTVGEVEPWATPTIAAGIPILVFTSADASLLGAPDLVFSMSNPANSVAYFPAALAKQVGATKTTIDVIDVPAATGPVQALAPVVFEDQGAGDVRALPISPTAPDHSTDIQAELQSYNPDLFHVIGNPAYCSLSFRALRDANYEGTISGISNCIDAAAKEQLGSDLEGIYLSYSAGEDPADPDYAQYLAILDKYDPSVVPHGTPVGSYVALESLRRVMADYSGDYTSASIADHIRNHGPLPHPTTGQTFQCNSKALDILPIACTSAFAYSQLDAEGNPTTFTGASV